jgi:hypothetical protein
MSTEQDLKALIAELRKAATEIAREGHAGWGNSCAQAADALDRLSAPVEELSQHSIDHIRSQVRAEIEARLPEDEPDLVQDWVYDEAIKVAYRVGQCSRLSTEQPNRTADIQTVAGFIAGWWPGLEDGISWGTDTTQHAVFLAAKRLLEEEPEPEQG